MKQIVAYLLMISMILSNNTMTIAAQVKSQSSVAEHSSEVVNIPDKYLLNAMLEQGDQKWRWAFDDRRIEICQGDLYIRCR